MTKTRTTTRSYTLGLFAPSDADDWLPLWDRLFRTHYAICRGAGEFGDFYLNLRGGLAASLANCSDEKDATRRKLLRRGSRRMLALGWLSVEDARGAQDHPYRIRGVKPGEPLPHELAESVLRNILQTEKGVLQEGEITDWVNDCILTLTANIRSDAVIVNRAAAFAAWQERIREGAAELPEQARQILFSMCGSGFLSLTLPDEASVEAQDAESESNDLPDSEIEAESTSKSEDAEEVEPSNASRGIFGDLFGGDAAEKLSRAAGKDVFATAVGTFLVELGNESPTRETIIAFRAKQNLPDLDISRPDKYPAEISSSGAPTAVAKRYRKLLVCLGLWPTSADEDGAPRTQAITSFSRRITARDESERRAQINAWDLIEACPKPRKNSDESKVDLSSQRVFTPLWASDLAGRVAAVTNMPVDAKSLNEFKRLMFALAARRISQTQSWTKRNEIERHKAAVKEDAAWGKLQELDRDERATKWLREYEDELAKRTGAAFGFRVTRRMIGECDEVFSAWKTVPSSVERDKQTAAIQAGAEKFGDPALYADLSADPRAEIIWRPEQGPEILKQWVKWRQAQYDQQRLKIPRFCHPDPFHHPTWCEFGGSSKPKVWYAWNPKSEPNNPESGGNDDGARRLWLQLPNVTSSTASPVPLRWHSKRLSKDLGAVHNFVDKPIPRADRLGVAAADLPLQDKDGERIHYRPQYPFTKDAKGWNARLQVDKDSLAKLEEVWNDKTNQWLDNGASLKRLGWFVTFAPSLAVAEGPWGELRSRLNWKKFPPTEVNDRQKREGSAKLILSRLPSLRVLSVDLGHRFAAACAVWEALSIEDFKRECDTASAKYGFDVTFADLYATIEGPEQKSKEASKKAQAAGRDRFRPTTLYRRIGEDFLRDNKTGKPTDTPHPAPWARLERQFFIKLQGEELPPRAASEKDEMVMVEQFAHRLGLDLDKNEERTLPRRVDELMARAVRIAQLGLARHGRRAKIANALDPQTTSVFGVGGKENRFQQGDKTHVNLLTETLFDWHVLASEEKWNDAAARKLWNTHVAKISGAWHIEEHGDGVTSVDERTRLQRRKDDDELRDRLKPVAEVLVAADRADMRAAWKKRWEDDDGPERDKSDYEKGHTRGTTVAKRPTSGWHADLRLLTDWIMGWYLPDEVSKLWTRNVGGLSLTRIATMRSLYQLHKAFAMRAKPDEPRGAPEKGESNAGVAKSILRAMERMREQRVKQIASRIATSALGLGGHWKEVKLPCIGNRKSKVKWVWVEELSAKYKPCHAVVIESLRNYRPDEIQTRRENRALMSWSAGKVRKYLEETCQLHGLHLREVLPNYTSRQCSRTGLPGLRCNEVPVGEFLTAPWWRKAVNVAKKKSAGNKQAEEYRLLVDLDKDWQEKWRMLSDKDKDKCKPLRLPRSGGDIFVAAPAWDQWKTDEEGKTKLTKRAVQADLNAAANIGLRALLDPDFPGKWWYVPCSAKDGTPAKDKVNGAACLELTARLIEVSEKTGAKRDYVNAWRDPSLNGNRDPQQDHHTPDSEDGWSETSRYWNGVRSRVIAVLRRFNGLKPTAGLSLDSPRSDSHCEVEMTEVF